MTVLRRAGSETYQASRRSLKQWTNAGLSLAVLIGIVVAWQHGGNVTTAIAWSGAALGAGGFLGFLFGIPAPAGRQPAPQPSSTTTVLKQPATGAPAGPAPGAKPAAPEPQLQAGDSHPPAPAPLQQPAEAPPQPTATPEPQKPPEAATQQPPADASSEPAPGAGSNLEQVADWVTKLLLGGGLTQLQVIPGKVWELAAWVGRGIAPAATGAALAAEQSFASGLLIYFFLLGFFSGYLITKLQLGDKFSF